jgi:hypothetical protein
MLKSIRLFCLADGGFDALALLVYSASVVEPNSK